MSRAEKSVLSKIELIDGAISKIENYVPGETDLNVCVFCEGVTVADWIMTANVLEAIRLEMVRLKKYNLAALEMLRGNAAPMTELLREGEQ